MAVVKYNEVDEYLEELKKDSDTNMVYGQIVRVSNLFTATKLSPNIHHVVVVSTYQSDNNIVRLEKYCGDVYRGDIPENDTVLQRAEEIQKKIKTACKELKLEVRGGVLEPE